MLDLALKNEAGSIRVLLVDDDASVLEISKQILLSMDDCLKIDFAHCAEEALEKLDSAGYDVIVSDYEMPIKNGLDLLKQLKEIGNGVPFILFTGKGREEIAIKALNLGADGYYNKQGSPETVYGELAHGIKIATQRKKAEEKLKQSNKTINSIINSTNDAIFAFDANWVVTYCNETFAKIGGLTGNEMVGKNARVVFADRIGTTLEKNLTEAMVKKEPKTFEWNGLYEPKVWEFNVFPMDNGFTVFAKDITERKKAEEELRLFSLAVETSVDGVIIGKPTGVITYVNGATLKMMGASGREEVLGKHVLEFIAERDRNRATEKSLKCLETGQGFLGQYAAVRKDGAEFQVEVTTSLIKDKTGQPIAFIDIIRNVDERQRTEDALRESHK
ncbi:MAG TPA: PAS domain S-box protein [Candidatus Limnocylindrales bacterium]|nr:PAS domain S-box protein [Candidatus Limnocylindrales bacterium]